MDPDTSDIGRAWEDALDKYCKDTGTNIKYLPQMKWSVEAIRAEQQRQVELFSKYRHNKGLTDKFRSVISKNSAIIQSVASNVANAATSAFPPSAAILTAFTYVMQASKNVSDDYDQVAAFFDVMGSMMERLSLIESKLPSAKNYRAILMRVFASLMGLCGTATYYVAHGRFKHWLKALFKGTDDDLTADYTKLQTNIQRLESATMFATLSTVIETKSDVKDLTAISMQSLKVGTQNLAVSTQNLSVTMETQSMISGLSVKYDETIKKFERHIWNQESKKDNEKEGPRKPKEDAGAKRNAALNLVKTMFVTQAEPAIQLKEMQAAFVPGTFGWVFEEDDFKTFMDGSPFLRISGPPGIGKSCVAYSIIRKLLESTSSDPRASVAYYFFREEHEELRSANNMLRAAVIQTAIGDGKYRDEIVAEMKATWEKKNIVDEVWRRCFVERYPKDAEQKLYLVLDGLGEADEEDQKQVLQIMQDIKRDELSIQVVFTSRPTEEIQLATSDLLPRIVDITKEKISKRGGDLWKIIMKRCKTLSKLKRLPKPAWRKIGVKLRLKADSVLYVEHMLRRLNALGREPLIFKELDKLPENLPKLYELLLADCQKDRAKEQLTALKKLFAWLAYSKRPLTLGEATSLIKIIPGTKSFSLEEEIDGRSARILDLATDVGGEESNSEESDSEITEKQIEEEDAISLDNSITSPLKFQERSMRQYFRAMEVEDNGLRSSPSLGHFTIFEMAAQILNTPETESTDDKGKDKMQQLRNYAATFWMEHFLDVDLKNTSDEGVRSVISSLHTIMNPEGEALKNIELCVYDLLTQSSMNDLGKASLFGGRENSQFFDHFNVWLNRARNLDVSLFSPEVLNWISSCSSQEKILTHLAKGHVLNWFQAKRSYKARASFEFARTTLRMAKIGPPLSKNTEMDQGHAEDDILKVSIAFPEIPKTSQALQAIGMVFYSLQNHSAALAQMNQSLEIATAIIDRFHTLAWVGDIQLKLSEKAEEEEQKDHVQKAYDAINASIALYESSDEVKKFARTEDMKVVVLYNLTDRARCEIKLGEIDKAIASMDEAYAVIGNTDAILEDQFIDDITASLEKAGDFEKLISVVGHFHKWDLLYWLGFPSANGHDRFQSAAWKCKKQEFMIKKYEDMIIECDKYNIGAHARSQLATIYRYVVPNLKESRRLLFEIMDGKKGAPFDDASENFIYATRLQLADVLLEQFRAATDPEQKIALQGDMKTLALQDKVALSQDFNPYESQTTTSLALMTGKMGPTNEFQSLMDNRFREAINSLTDNQAWNDSGGFRALAKVLAFVPEMHKDAQIASSLQFSAVDEKLFKEADESRDEQSSDTNMKEPLANGHETEPAVEEKETVKQKIIEVEIQSQEGSLIVQEIQLPTTTTEEATADIPEDLNPYSSIYCNGCQRSFNNWREGAVYGCIECTDCDLCEDCFKKIDRCNKGEPWTEWKRYCGENHKYIRAPIAGWKGVKDGVIRIEKVGDGEQGVEELNFGVWLDGLQDRWKEAWKGFWKREELVFDIL